MRLDDERSKSLWTIDAQAPLLPLASADTIMPAPSASTLKVQVSGSGTSE
jgi:hypothetical protein